MNVESIKIQHESSSQFCFDNKNKLEFCITTKGANVLHNGVFILSLFIRLQSDSLCEASNRLYPSFLFPEENVYLKGFLVHKIFAIQILLNLPKHNSS